MRHDLPSTLEDLLDAFDAAWQLLPPPRLEDFLPPPAVPHYREVLVGLVRVDLERRIKAREPARVEDYLHRFPQLREGDDTLVELVLLERELRGRHDPAFQAAEYAARFPELSSRMHMRLPTVILTPATSGGTAPTPDGAGGELDLRDHVLLELVGRGGMGEVYRGRDPALSRNLAVKVLRPELRDRPVAERRFQQEARINGLLEHPSIVPVHNLGRLPDGRLYFTMKLVQGRTLAAILAAGQDGPGRLPELLGIFEKVCQALAYAHSHRVIHRDLKPANVMVGAFGEVQVMDWGLAKVLAGQTQTPADENALGLGFDTKLAGSTAEEYGPTGVVGTPSYMAPEQARGAAVDERADVFGLGAILCEVLTGQPPYRGPGGYEILARAKQADLAEARARLDACGADGALLALARNCLAAEAEARPANGAAVAAVVAAYRQEVQRRLKAAEIAAAAAAARAEEEKKLRIVEAQRAEAEAARAEEEVRRRQVERQRRRAAVGLAAAVVLLVLVGSAAGLWQVQQAAERQVRGAALNEEVRLALAESEEKLQQLREQVDEPKRVPELLSEPDKWRDQLRLARLAWQQAQKLSSASEDLLQAEVAAGVSRVRQRLEWEESGYKLAEQLDQVRLRTLTLVDGKWDPKVAAREYPGVFAAAGLAIEPGQEAALAARIKASPARPALVAALDHWATVEAKGERQQRLLALVRQVDPNPWRDRFREVQVWNDVAKLEGLAKEVRVAEQSPQVLVALALRLLAKGGKQAALLRQAVRYRHSPRDFWLYFVLGNAVTDPVERVGWFQAALAVRPESGLVHTSLADALRVSKDLEGAIQHGRIAIAIDPNNAWAYTNLGAVLHETKDLVGAIKHLQTAIEIDPKFAPAYTNLGNVLRSSKNLAGAIKHHRIAIQLDPKNALAHYNLGNALCDSKDLEGGIKHYRLAIEIDPNYTRAHNNLGAALRDSKDLKGAIQHYLITIDLDRKDATAHYNLGQALSDSKDLKGAIQHFRIAIALDPKDAPAHYNLGNALYHSKELEEAIQHYRNAIAIDPQYAPAHNNLGYALRQSKDLNGAIKHGRLAVAIDPKDAQAHNNLGNALSDSRDLKGAIQHYRKAIDLDPKFATAHRNLCDALRDNQELTEAIKHGRIAVELDPKDALTHNSLGNAFYDSKELKGALQHYRNAIAIDPKYATAHVNLCNALRDNQDLAGAIQHGRLAVELDPKNALAHNNLGNALGDHKELGEAIQHYRKAIDLNPKYTKAHNNLGNVLLQQKDLAGAIAQYRQAIAIDPKYANLTTDSAVPSFSRGNFSRLEKAIQQFGKLLPPGHPRQKLVQQQLQQYDRLLGMERKLDAFIGKGETPEQPQELLFLIDLVIFKQYHATAARLYATAFTTLPGLAEDLNRGHRYQAAHSALLAAAGQGRDPVKLTLQEQTKLRAWALTWLQADLQLWIKRFQARDHKALPGLVSYLPAWQQDPALAVVRDTKERTQLPANEQPAWQQLWFDVEQLLRQVAANVRTTPFKGTLTAKERERVHEVKLQAGQGYLIDLESRQFDTYLRLHDDKGKLLAENDDITPGVNLNSRLLFTAPADGTYRLVATSFEQRGSGAYTLTVRSFVEAK